MKTFGIVMACAAGLTFVALTGVARASEHDEDVCTSRYKSPQEIVDACTRLIQAGATRGTLVAFYYDRGLARTDLRD